MSAGAGGIGRLSCGNRREWSNFLQEQEGLVKLFVERAGIDQVCVWEQVGLVTFPEGV